MSEIGKKIKEEIERREKDHHEERMMMKVDLLILIEVQRGIMEEIEAEIDHQDAGVEIVMEDQIAKSVPLIDNDLIVVKGKVMREAGEATRDVLLMRQDDKKRKK